MIAVIDNSYSNLKSITNALIFLDISHEVIKARDLSDKYSHAIIPGVGNFSTAMNDLKKKEEDIKIVNFFKLKKPIMGICLGMQILASLGDEGGPTNGLSLIPGSVKKMDSVDNEYLPHIGWNSVKILKNHPVLNGIKDEMDFYFVHSYKFNLENTKHALGETFYCKNFNSIVGKDNVIGFQFHPEKSQKYGLKILKNFFNWDGTC
jgi:glutamine amidotransferase